MMIDEIFHLDDFVLSVVMRIDSIGAKFAIIFICVAFLLGAIVGSMITAKIMARTGEVIIDHRVWKPRRRIA
jgi:hypothetical protein